MSSNYERDKANVEKWRKENVSRVVINLKKEDKEKWQAYADAQGIQLATLIRSLMDAEMNK